MNIGLFLDFGAAIYGLANIPLGSALEAEVPTLLLKAKGFLEIFSDTETPLSLDVSRPTAQQLLRAIELAFASLPSPPDDQIKNISDARNLAIQLQLLLSQELNKQAVYHVFPKRAYDTNILIEDATRLFSDETRKSLSGMAAHDVAEAGRCLAFELPTAAAFHLMRAAESVIREYYGLVVGQLPKTKHRNWGAYIRVLKEKGADVKILATLDQIRELHRNPILHPELQLDLEEATSLVGIVESEISGMIAEIKILGPKL